MAKLFEAKSINPNEIIIKKRFRKTIGDIKSLKESIAKDGLINPILVTKNNILIAGERRLTAVKELGLNSIDVRISPDINPDHLLILEMMENTARKDFTWEEELLLKNTLHEYWTNEAKENNISWGYRESAKKLNVSLGGFSTDLVLARALKSFPELKECETKNQAKIMYKKMGNQAEAIQSFNNMPEEEQNKLSKMLKGDFTPTKNKKDIKNILTAIHTEEDLPDYNEITSSFKNEQESKQKKKNNKAEAIYSIESYVTFIDKFKDSSISMVELDPPYAIDFNTNYCKLSKVKSKATDWTTKELYDFYALMLPKIYNKLLTNAWVLCWVGKEHWIETNKFAEKAGFKTQPFGVWVKPGGSSNTPSTNMISNYEVFLLFRKGHATFNTSSVLATHHFDPSASSQRIHQWEKPVELYRYFINILGIPNGIFLSLFAGSGNSLIAAYKEKMIPMGCDKSQKYIYEFYNKFNKLYN